MSQRLGGERREDGPHPEGALLASSDFTDSVPGELLFVHTHRPATQAFVSFVLGAFTLATMFIVLANSDVMTLGAFLTIFSSFLVCGGAFFLISVGALMGVKVTVFSDRIMIRNVIRTTSVLRSEIRSFSRASDGSIRVNTTARSRKKIYTNELGERRTRRLLDQLNAWLVVPKPSDAKRPVVQDAPKPDGSDATK